MLKSQQKLMEALTLTGLVQPVNFSTSGLKRLWVLCRLVPGQEAAWLKVVQGLLTAYGEDIQKGHDIVIARRYVLKGGQMVFGWYLSLEAPTTKELDAHIERLLPVLAEAKPSLVPMQQAPARVAETRPPAPAAPAPRRAVEDTTPIDDKDAAIDQEIAEARREAERLRKSGQAPRLFPRPPEEDGSPDPQPPRGFVPQIRTVVRGRDNKGRPMTIQEIPLPNVYEGDLNRPKHKFGRGATTIGGGP